MDKLDRYSSLCSLIKEISDKEKEIIKLKHQASKLQYDVDSINLKIESYADVYMNDKEIQKLRYKLMKKCLKLVGSYANGGVITVIDIDEFKNSIEFMSAEPEVKVLFEKAQVPLSAYEDSLSNAILIGQEDNEDFNVYESGAIEDFVDEVVMNIDGYETARYNDLKELKKLMYKFVEQVSNN